MSLQTTPTLEQVRVNYDDYDVDLEVKPWLKVRMLHQMWRRRRWRRLLQGRSVGVGKLSALHVLRMMDAVMKAGDDLD
jgi:hypothetical protein